MSYKPISSISKALNICSAIIEVVPFPQSYTILSGLEPRLILEVIKLKYSPLTLLLMINSPCPSLKSPFSITSYILLIPSPKVLYLPL